MGKRPSRQYHMVCHEKHENRDPSLGCMSWKMVFCLTIGFVHHLAVCVFVPSYETSTLGEGFLVLLFPKLCVLPKDQHFQQLDQFPVGPSSSGL